MFLLISSFLISTKAHSLVKKTDYRFAIISDMNGSYGSKKYSADVKRGVSFITDPSNKVDFVISTGDMVAGQKSGLDYSGMWRAFHKAVTQPLLQSQIAIYPSPGNHDAYITRKTERNHYKNSWAKQDPLSQSKNMEFVQGVEQNFPFQYAFTIGEALFIAMDNTAAQPWKESALTWLENVLEIGKDKKLKFIYGHIPVLPFAFKKEREYVAKNFDFLKRLEALFDKYNVDAFFSGHSHVYYPGRRDAHTQYISVPLLGGGPRYLLQKKKGTRSRHGFLIIDFNEAGDWNVTHHASKDFQIIEDQSFPKFIQMPANNSSLCSGCSRFPKTHFLDAGQRIVYRRSDQHH